MPTTLRQIITVAIGALSLFVYGIDYGYLGGVLAVPEFIEKYGTLDPSTGLTTLHSDRLSLLTSTVYIGTVFGCFLAPFVSARIGKKWGLVAGCISFCVAGALQVGAINFEMFMVGRALGGVHIAFANIMGPAYVNEVAPKHLRGFGIVLCLQLVTFGNFFSSIVTLAATSRPDHLAYQIPILLCIMAGGLVALLLLFMPDTPLYLVEKGRPERARTVLAKMRSTDIHSSEVNEEFEELQAAFENKEETGRWAELFNRDNRRRTMMSVGTLVLMNGASGCNFYLTYASVFMKQAGFTSPWGITVLIAGTNCFTTTPALWLVERLGRRTLMAIGCAGAIIFNLASGVSYTVGHGGTLSSKLLVAFVTLYVFFFAAFIGPSGWAYSAEISSQRTRSKTLALAQLCSNVIVWGVGYGSPYLFQDPVNLKASFCYVWLGGCVLCSVFFYFNLYETSGLSHAEIDRLLASGVPARRSRVWGRQVAASRVEADSTTATSLAFDMDVWPTNDGQEDKKSDGMPASTVVHQV